MLKLRFKVWREGQLIAACAFAEEAAAVVALAGGQIRVGNRIVWRDGELGIRAEDSLDMVAQAVYERIK